MDKLFTSRSTKGALLLIVSLFCLGCNSQTEPTIDQSFHADNGYHFHDATTSLAEPLSSTDPLPPTASLTTTEEATPYDNHDNDVYVF